MSYIRQHGFTKEVRTLKQEAPMIAGFRMKPSEGENVRSRIGGEPDLPENIKWPKASSGENMYFVGQIGLAEAAEVSSEHIVDGCPDKGMAFFFSAQDNKSGKVIYSAEADDARPRPTPEDIPEDKRWLANPALLKPYSEYDFTDFDEILSTTKTSQNFKDDIFGYYQAFTQGDAAKHKLFGRLNPQYDVLRAQCHAEMKARGEAEVDLPAYISDEAIAPLKNAAQEWILLAQFDSDLDTGVIWDEEGLSRIYYLIRKSDLANGNLEKAEHVYDYLDTSMPPGY